MWEKKEIVSITNKHIYNKQRFIYKATILTFVTNHEDIFDKYFFILQPPIWCPLSSARTSAGQDSLCAGVSQIFLERGAFN